MKYIRMADILLILFNPALVKVSYGDLPLSNNITVSTGEKGYLQFTWDSTQVEGGSEFNQVMLLAYNIEKGKAYYKITGQLRNTGADVLNVDRISGDTLHVYVAFNAADRSRQSHSVYLGTVTV